MKTLPITLMLLLAGCNQSNSSRVDPREEGEWTPGNRASFQFSCEQTVLKGNNQEYAEAYCQCMLESVTPRWSYSDLQQDEASVLEALTEEGAVANCLQSANKPHMKALSKSALAAGMPDGFFGVVLNSSIEDVKAARPHVLEGDGSLEEIAEWNGQKYDVFYAVNPFSKEVFLISLERPAGKKSYLTTNSELVRRFGALSPPVKSDPWQLKSERTAGGVKLTHVLSNEGTGNTRERVTLVASGN